jgi:hypothetical protein
VRANRLLWSLAAVAFVAVPRTASPDPAPYVLAGELARVSLVRSSVTVKVAGTPPREVEVRVDPGTMISSRGRALRLGDLRTGERILAACADDPAGVRHAQRIKLGGGKARP